MISDSIKRIDQYSAENVIIKSYFKKFNSELNEWYPANCLINEKKCDFTKQALYQIKIAKEQDNSDFKNNSQDLLNQNDKQFNTSKDQNLNLNFIVNPQEMPLVQEKNEQCEGGPENC